MSKSLSAKHHHENKERLQKKTGERYQNLSREEKVVVNVTKISQKMKNINWLNIEKKNLYNEKKCLTIIMRKYFNLENFVSL